MEPELAGEGKFRVYIKPNSARNEILGYDSAKKAFKIAISQPADKNKANMELVKFLRKKTGKSCEILSGFSSREKLLRLF